MPFEHAVAAHRLSGAVVGYAALLHGALWGLKWALADLNVLESLFTSMDCFVGQEISGRGECRDDKSDHCSCYELLRNLAGFVAALAFLGILLSSMEWVRRKHYSLFYYCHVIFALVGFIFSVLHYNKMLLYGIPSVALYSISLAITFWERLLDNRPISPSDRVGSTESGSSQSPAPPRRIA